MGVEPEVKRAGTVFVRPWVWEGVTGVEPGARVGVIPGEVDALLETNTRDLTWDEFTTIQIHAGAVERVLSSKLSERDATLQQIRLDVDFGDTVGKKHALMWLRAPFLDTSQLVGRQLLAVTNLAAPSSDSDAVKWFEDGAAAVLTVNGRTILEPAKVVDNGFCLA